MPAGDPRLTALADGLSSLGGGTPLPQGPSEPAATPSTTPLMDLFMKARVAGLDDTNAALAVARHLREQADLRSGFRDAGNVAAGRPLDLGYRQQLMSEADRPLQDLAARRATGPLAAEEVGRQATVAGQDIALQQQRGLLDPRHPTNVATRAILAKAGINVPPNTIAPALPKDLWDQIRPLAERATAGERLAVETPGLRATTAKTQAEAARTNALTAPEVAKTGAEAEKLAAEAAVERQKVGGQVAPGWTRNGTVANVGDKEIQDFRTQATAAADTDRITKQLLGLLGSSDFVANGQKRAKAAILSGKLLGSMKNSMGIRGLPAQDVAFLEKMTGDFSMASPLNLIGYTNNPTRLKTLNANAQAELESQARTLGLSKQGAGPGVATHYLVSPDGKSRIAADASGKPLPGAKPEPTSNDDAAALAWAKANPNDPRASKILTLASPKVATQ